MQAHPPTVQPGAAPGSPSPQAMLRTAVTLAELLHRVESSQPAIGADQYRRLVQHLAHLLGTLAGQPALGALLDAFPAAAAVYENLHYAQAGLCRAPLQASLDSELQARAAIDRARSRRPAA